MLDASRQGEAGPVDARSRQEPRHAGGGGRRDDLRVLCGPVLLPLGKVSGGENGPVSPCLHASHPLPAMITPPLASCQAFTTCPALDPRTTEDFDPLSRTPGVDGTDGSPCPDINPTSVRFSSGMSSLPMLDHTCARRHHCCPNGAVRGLTCDVTPSHPRLPRSEINQRRRGFRHGLSIPPKRSAASRRYS